LRTSQSDDERRGKQALGIDLLGLALPQQAQLFVDHRLHDRAHLPHLFDAIVVRKVGQHRAARGTGQPRRDPIMADIGIEQRQEARDAFALLRVVGDQPRQVGGACPRYFLRGFDAV
jgi:hypothetical protein